MKLTVLLSLLVLNYDKYDHMCLLSSIYSILSKHKFLVKFDLFYSMRKLAKVSVELGHLISPSSDFTKIFPLCLPMIARVLTLLWYLVDSIQVHNCRWARVSHEGVWDGGWSQYKGNHLWSGYRQCKYA